MIFDRFYKTDKSRSKDKTGMGLGLYIVRTIIRLHGGEITVSSVENEYCQFSFWIPKYTSSDSSSGESRKENKDKKNTSHSGEKGTEGAKGKDTRKGKEKSGKKASSRGESTSPREASGEKTESPPLLPEQGKEENSGDTIPRDPNP